ncbi:hypothetical protein K402DRAFT_409903 [Aulographum hederae CBS 113979]|uniref:C2H2-type domain-containing protein n=1 Tax=Aulographum hederae CBS 113979 TaxID=1176131 RepID=A0A6G1HCT9_9PEZI|nr:hypothetical protein K402DRAFT_409903 [Aulographum hederae CBS 113979]
MASESRVFPCNTCSITFQTSELQRSHMRGPWHVNNLRRRVAELPALPEEEFSSQVKSQDSGMQGKRRISSHEAEADPASSSEKVPEAEEEIFEKVPPTKCLFCNMNSTSLDANIDHMSSQHGLFIPSRNQLSDLESFLGYLATIIFEYHECLYCGLEKPTVDGVQAHMRDKGHCMINVDAESELLDFWELSDSEGEDDGGNEGKDRAKSPAIKLSETEMRLPSGAVINSRSDTTQLRVKPGIARSRTKGSQYRLKRDEMKAIAAAENQDPAAEEQSGPSRSTNDRRVAVRGEMGLLGVPEAERRSLQITEKKMKKREAVAKSAQRHAMEQQPTKMIYYKTENPVYQAG